MRIVKHLGGRVCAADEAKLMLVVPTFSGEKLSFVQLSAYFACGGDSPIDQPSEVNWYGLFIPWSVLWATDLAISGGGAIDFSTAAQWDELFEKWVFETGGDAGEKFGGDVDADPEGVAGEEEHSDEELLNSGPIGPQRWFAREVVMAPHAAEGVNKVRFGDAFSARLNRLPSSGFGGVHMFGIVRFDENVEANWNVELDDATSKAAMGLMMSGDYSRVQAMIQGNTAALGDYIRTVLFGGDNFVEGSTLKGLTGKGVVKGVFGIDSLLLRRPRI